MTGQVSPLMQAKYRGDEKTVSELLAEGHELDVFEAAAIGRLERLRALLSADPALASVWTADGFTALHYAAFFGQPDAACVLLEHGADPHAVARNAMRVQPLHSAAAAGNLEAARLLLEAGADPNAVQQGDFRPLDAVIQNRDEAFESLLLAYGARP